MAFYAFATPVDNICKLLAQYDFETLKGALQNWPAPDPAHLMAE